MMHVMRWVGVVAVALVVGANIGTTHAQLVIATPAPAPAPAPGTVVRDVLLAPSGPTQLPAGGSLGWRLSFTFAAQQPRQVETVLAWRVGAGSLQYGQPSVFNAVPGQNSDQRQSLRAPATVNAAFEVQVYGVVRVDGLQYSTSAPITVTIVPGGAGPAPNPVAPTPQPTQAFAPPAPPGPPQNPHIARVRAALTERGLRVREVEYTPGQAGKPPRVFVAVDADYVQPGWGPIINLASKVHATIYQTFPLETQETRLGAAQVWQRYVIVVWARAADITAFLQAHKAATTDAQRGQLWEAFVETLRFGVFDTQTGQQVDVKDFTNKNFAR
jgi:hypothetical protein